MPVRLTNIENLQQIEAVVSGPDNANRLFIVTGVAPANLSALHNQTQKETFTFLIGPILTRRQFVKAIATASLNRVFLFAPSAPTSISNSWLVSFVDADWDDESGQVEVRFEVSVSSGPNTTSTVTGVSFQATILAEIGS
ncbi:MAG: hypothetical protein L0Y68_09590 [Candidatus Dadabacteria bacterium]|nr:hypothetical protein [Candidatus Dadabacteria bacterium]